MPALPPPSMTIGAPAPGYAPQAVSGPTRTVNAPPALPSIIQSSGAATTVSGPTNIVHNVSATKPGTLLVWVVVVNASSAVALGGTPTGWTFDHGGVFGGTLQLGAYIVPGASNPGGTTSVTFSSNATATLGGIASWFWELDNCPFTALNVHNTNSGSGTTPHTTVTFALPGGIALAAIAWVLGTATFSNTSTGTLPWTLNAQQSSTNGTTNAALITMQNLQVVGQTTPGSAQGTLSASAGWLADYSGVPSTASGETSFSGTRALVDGAPGGGYSSGDAGNTGWSLGPGRAGFSGGIGSQ